MSTGAPTTRPARLPRLGKASRTLGRLWQVPTFLIGLFIFLTVAASAPLRKDPVVVQFEQDLQRLREGLAPGAEPIDTLLVRAENLLARLSKFTRRSAEVHFLVGSVYFRQAANGPEGAAQEARGRAIQHLEEAFQRGVSPEDQPALLYRLGWTIYHHGTRDQDTKRAIELMTLGVEKGSDLPSAAYGLLVQAHLRREKPDMAGALAASQKQIELTDDRNVPAMSQARLTQAELLLRQGQRLEAIKELERIGGAAPPEVRGPALLLHAQACETEGLWDQAIPLWKELLTKEAKVPGGKAKVLYHLGLAHQNASPPQVEEAARHWEQALALGGEEGRAAGLRLGELHINGSLPDPSRGLTHWTAALASLRSHHDYGGILVPLEKARTWFEDAFKVFIEGQEFRRGEELALVYKKIAEPGRADELLAEALFALAGETKEKLRGQPAKLADKKQEELRGQFHRAAVAYDQASTKLKEPASVLWKAARAYLEAQDNAHAVTALDRFVRVEKEEPRLAEAWLSLAEAHLALGDKDKARLSYYKCIEYPSTPFANRARYQLALEETEKKNYDQARNILEQNVKNITPDTDRTAHEKSLYLLARILILKEDFSQAVQRLHQATLQYPANPLALTARDQLADCHRKLGDQEKTRMNAARTPEQMSHYRKKWLAELNKAHDIHQKMVDDLEAKSRLGELTSPEKALLRRALFGAADARFDMNSFEEALRLYQGIQARHRKKIESLFACQRIFKCVPVMNDSPAQQAMVRAAAQQAVTFAREDLASLPADSEDFRGPGVWPRDEWAARLQEIQERLNALATVTKSPGPAIR